MNLSCTNQHAIVCGSTQGIGKATAVELTQMGAKLTLVARNEEKLKAVVSELNAINQLENDYIVADFSNPNNLEEALANYAAAKPNYSFQILVNNTGGPQGGPITQASTTEFLAAFNAHLICNHILVQWVQPKMIANKYGRIINVISTSVKIPLKGLGVSNTIRGAVASWSKTMANELGIHNITVNNVLPGATNTARLQSIIANKANKLSVEEQEIQTEMANEVPMKRVAEPHEVAAAIAFLASPAASYINGVSLPVDGGRTGSI